MSDHYFDKVTLCCIYCNLKLSEYYNNETTCNRIMEPIEPDDYELWIMGY